MTFAEEMAELEAAHYAARLPGDGLAVVAPRFMHFDGARVQPPPTREEWWQTPEPRVFHHHDEACLVATDEAPAMGQADRSVGPGWWRCQVTGIVVHDHGVERFAHLVGDSVCPLPRDGS